MTTSSEIKKQWQLFCQDNDLYYTPYNEGNINKYISNATFKDYDDLIKEFTSKSIVICPKCKDNNVNWQGVQTRRADEAQTIFCKCQNENCKYEWKF